jgi:hypothetical protein
MPASHAATEGRPRRSTRNPQARCRADEFALRTVELTPGENRLTVTVPALYPLQVHCPDVRGSAGVVAQRLALPLLDPRWVEKPQMRQRCPSDGLYGHYPRG